MKLTVLNSGQFKLDGGAMFGVVPKRMWSKLNPPDTDNMCTWGLQCLLLETETRKILVDTGMGDKQDAKFMSHFYPTGNGIVAAVLAHGLQPEEITDVFLTHLHFDHVGGAVKRNDSGQFVPAFPQATYWSNDLHYDWAYKGNPREKASFLHENFVPLREAGILKMLDAQADPFEWVDGIRVHTYFGHTMGMMGISFTADGQFYHYPADLMPSQWHVGLPYVMAYDMQPIKTLEEKERLLSEVQESGGIILLEHDPSTIGMRLEKDERGRLVGQPI